MTFLSLSLPVGILPLAICCSMVAAAVRVLRGFLVLVQFSEPSLPACLGLAIFVGLAVVFGKLGRKVPAKESSAEHSPFGNVPLRTATCEKRNIFSKFDGIQ
jgi:hypothetical protein